MLLLEEIISIHKKRLLLEIATFLMLNQEYMQIDTCANAKGMVNISCTIPITT